MCTIIIIYNIQMLILLGDNIINTFYYMKKKLNKSYNAADKYDIDNNI